MSLNQFILTSIRLVGVTSMVVILFQTSVLGQNENRFIDLIASLEKQFEVIVSYDPTIFQDRHLGTSNMVDRNQDLAVNLSNIFENSGLSYRVLDGNKVLLRKNASVELHTQTIKGRVFTKDTQNGLSYASVFVPGTTRGTITDELGYFSVEVKESELLKIQFLGFEETTIDPTTFTGSVYLKPSSFAIEEVTIVIHPSVMTSPGSHKTGFDVSSWLEKSASSIYGNDLIKSIQMLPGIIADDDEGGKLSLRGSGSDEVLMVLDGIPLYKVDHYYGIFGAVNSFYIDKVNLYKNNFPIQHDYRTGGLLIMESPSVTDGLQGQVEIDFLKTNAGIQYGNENFSINLGARYNHTDPFNSLLRGVADTIDVSNAFIDRQNLRRRKVEQAIPEFRFYDINAKVEWRINPKHTLELSGLLVQDEYDRLYENTFPILIDKKLAQNQEGFVEREEWKNGGLAINYQYAIGKDKSLNARLFNTRYRNDNAVGLRVFLQNRDGVLFDGSYKSENSNRLASAGMDIYFQKAADFTLGLGLQARENRFSVAENEKFQLSRKQDLNELNIYGNKSFILGGRTSLDFGLKANFIQDLNLSTLSPSISLLSSVDDNWTVKASYARLYQNIRELQFESRLGLSQQYFVLPDGELYPQGISQNLMAGFGYQNNGFGIDVELYRKKLDGAIGYLTDRVGIGANRFLPSVESFFRIFEGEMNSRGMDILLSLERGPLYTQLAYTWSKSENTFKEVYGGNAFPSLYDRRHQFKWLGSLEMAKGLIIGSNVIYTSGRPYSSFDALTEIRNRDEARVEDIIVSLPDYFRLDVSLRYEHKMKSISPYIMFSLHNVTNRSNVRYIQQTVRLRSDNINLVTGFESPLLERISNISIGLKF